MNPNVAQKLIAELPPVEVEQRVTFCDGGSGALGHPRVYINLVKNFFRFLTKPLTIFLQLLLCSNSECSSAFLLFLQFSHFIFDLARFSIALVT